MRGMASRGAPERSGTLWQTWRFRWAAGAAIAIVLVVAGISLGCDDPLGGATSAGDSYLPRAGNGGYDVSSYDIALKIDPIAGTIEGKTIVEATALQALTSFSLDFLGPEIGTLTVEGSAAEYQRDGQELIVSPPDPPAAGETFSVAVSYAGIPGKLKGTGAPSFGSLLLGWQQVGDVIYTIDEPEGAATWFPANDHPSDKATYTFSLTVPRPYVAVASGVLVDTQVQGTDQIFVWEMQQPLASYLAAVSVDEYVLSESVAPNGVRIRDYFAAELAEEAKAAFARTGEVLAYFAELFGPYPFEEYGVVVPSVNTGAAMENQSLSLFGRDLLETFISTRPSGRNYSPRTGAPVVREQRDHRSLAGYLAERGVRYLRELALAGARPGSRRSGHDGEQLATESGARGASTTGGPGPGRDVRGDHVYAGRADSTCPPRDCGRRCLLRPLARMDHSLPVRECDYGGLHRSGQRAGRERGTGGAGCAVRGLAVRRGPAGNAGR